MLIYQYYCYKIWPKWYIYKYVLHFQLKPILHMNYKLWLQTVEIFMMTILLTHLDDKIRCKDHLQIEKLTNIMESACSPPSVQFFFSLRRN